MNKSSNEVPLPHETRDFAPPYFEEINKVSIFSAIKQIHRTHTYVQTYTNTYIYMKKRERAYFLGRMRDFRSSFCSRSAMSGTYKRT